MGEDVKIHSLVGYSRCLVAVATINGVNRLVYSKSRMVIHRMQMRKKLEVDSSEERAREDVDETISKLPDEPGAPLVVEDNPGVIDSLVRKFEVQEAAAAVAVAGISEDLRKGGLTGGRRDH